MLVPFIKCACRGKRCGLSVFSPLHGKRSGYTVNGCRCEPCLEANRLYLRDYNARRDAHRGDPLKHERSGEQCKCGNTRCRLTVNDERHGTTTGHKAKCICAPCRRAGADSKNAKRGVVLDPARPERWNKFKKNSD